MNKNCINNLKSVYFIISFFNSISMVYCFFLLIQATSYQTSYFRIQHSGNTDGSRLALSLSKFACALSFSVAFSMAARERERMRSLAVVVCFVVVVVGCLCAAASYAAFRCSCASKLCCQLIFSN